VARVGDDDQRRDARREGGQQALGAGTGDHLVMCASDQRRRHRDGRGLAHGFVGVLQQPAHREPPELRSRQPEDAVVGRHEHEARHRAFACDANRDARAEAAADRRHVRMRARDEVVQRQRVALQRGFGWRAAAAAVAAVVQRIDRVVGEGARQFGQALRDIFAIAAEVDQRLRPLVWLHRHAHFHVDARQRDFGGRRPVARLGKVQQRALEGIEHPAQAEVAHHDQRCQGEQQPQDRRPLSVPGSCSRST